MGTKDFIQQINSELKKLGSFIILESGRAEYKNRFNQFSENSIDFWENGICVQSYTKTKSIEELSLLIYYWCELRLSAIEIEKRIPSFPITIKLKLLHTDLKKYLENNWEDIYSYSLNFGSLITKLKENPKTKYLMAFRQLYDLGLNQNIGFCGRVFKNDLLRIRTTDQDGIFKVLSFENFIEIDIGDLTTNSNNLGFGNSDEVIKIINDNLPANIAVARYQSLEDWEKNYCP